MVIKFFSIITGKSKDRSISVIKKEELLSPLPLRQTLSPSFPRSIHSPPIINSTKANIDESSTSKGTSHESTPKSLSIDLFAPGSTGTTICNYVEYRFKVLKIINPDTYRVQLYDGDKELNKCDIDSNKLNFSDSYILV